MTWWDVRLEFNQTRRRNIKLKTFLTYFQARGIFYCFLVVILHSCCSVGGGEQNRQVYICSKSRKCHNHQATKQSAPRNAGNLENLRECGKSVKHYYLVLWGTIKALDKITQMSMCYLRSYISKVFISSFSRSLEELGNHYRCKHNSLWCRRQRASYCVFLLDFMFLHRQ